MLGEIAGERVVGVEKAEIGAVGQRAQLLGARSGRGAPAVAGRMRGDEARRRRAAHPCAAFPPTKRADKRRDAVDDDVDACAVGMKAVALIERRVHRDAVEKEGIERHVVLGARARERSHRIAR